MTLWQSSVVVVDAKAALSLVAACSTYHILLSSSTKHPRSVTVYASMRFLLLVCTALTALPAAQIPLNNKDVIVCYGDSITEQHLYSACIEGYVLTKYPDKQLTVWNFGWGGDTAFGGGRRYARDVQPVQPQVVFVAFGMNDGGYRAPDDAVKASYLANQRRLVETIRAGEALPVLLTSTPIDPDHRDPKDVYNSTLEGLANGLIALGTEMKVPVIDQFHPVLTALNTGKKWNKDFTFMYDSVHPNTAGQVVMAYNVIKQLPDPAPAGSVTIVGITATGSGASAANVLREPTGVSFFMTLTRIPLWVPKDARIALSLVPFQQECNGLYLKVDGLDAQANYRIDVDGAAAGNISGAEASAGVDIALMDGAPWTRQAHVIWDLGQIRWRRHQDVWRQLDLMESPEALAMPEMEKLKSATRAVVDALWEQMRVAAKPHTYRVALRKANPVVITKVFVSPVYPMTRDFSATFAPETGAPVAWTPATMTPEGDLDLNEILKKPLNCAAYVKVVFSADRSTVLNLSMGSDDGLIVIVSGQRLLSKDVYRGVNPGEEQLDVPLVAGRNEILFRVNNGAGGYGLNLRASTLGAARVTASER